MQKIPPQKSPKINCSEQVSLASIIWYYYRFQMNFEYMDCVVPHAYSTSKPLVIIKKKSKQFSRTITKLVCSYKIYLNMQTYHNVFHAIVVVTKQLMLYLWKILL